jgi:sulfoxide reductase heme-binding subunit YedZ
MTAKPTSRTSRVSRARWIHAGVGIAVSLPAASLAIAFLRDALGPDPIEELTHETGAWALRFLLASLAVTPARRLMGVPALAPYRRTLGLAAFGYACLHVSTYVALDWFFDWAEIWEDVAERPYVTAGFAAFLALVPLAVTSTRAAMRRLGGRRWRRLHQLVYPAAGLAVVHFLWLVKKDLREPAIYAGVLAVLLLARAVPAGGLRSGVRRASYRTASPGRNE